TYRNSQELIDIAGSFILKNKKQLKKNLKSNKKLLNPIQIIWYENEKNTFLHLLEKLFQEGKRNIMILGRNNRDIEEVLSHEFHYQNGTLTWVSHPEMNLYYKTVHRSKGLEEEIVIVLHLEHRENGFPNLRKESKVQRKLFSREDTYLYSEERRLFYVALTRTKNEVYLLTSRKRPSIFVLELKNIMKRREKRNQSK
ncbi:MAG: DNA helicase UvrD, partial [Bacilli bacterium]|nr:DNA helicase UvrD [Bacilli bacterium]